MTTCLQKLVTAVLSVPYSHIHISKETMEEVGFAYNAVPVKDRAKNAETFLINYPAYGVFKAKVRTSTVHGS